MSYRKKLMIEDRKNTFLPNTRVVLVNMENEPYTKLPQGTKGTVQFVDDIGTVHVRWDNGSCLGAVLEDDISPEYEPCEFCGIDIPYGFSLCTECDSTVSKFDEKTGLYILKDGTIVDTTKHQY